MIKPGITLILWSLVSIGLIGALRVSNSTWTTDNDCPSLGSIYICYVVLSGYVLIAIALITRMPLKNHLFYAGWLPVFLFAITGTTLEVVNGQTCPRSDSGLPMCFVSLALTVAILALFLLINKMASKSSG